MKTYNIEIDGKHKLYTCPDNWNEVTVKMYRELHSLDLSDVTSDYRKRAHIISIFLGLDVDTIMLFDPTSFVEVENSLAFLSTNMEMNENIESVKINDEEYFLYKDYHLFKVGEIITIEELIKSGEGNLLKVYNKLLTLFLRKKTESGELEKFNTNHLYRDKIFDDLLITDVNSLLIFFLNIEKK